MGRSSARLNIWASMKPATVTPLSIFGEASVLQWCRSDLGVHLTGSQVDRWDDQGIYGNDYVGTTTTRPTYTATDATIGGYPSINFAKASSQVLIASAFTLPAPGTTPTWAGLIFRYRSWTNGAAIICANDALSMMLRQAGSAAPNMKGVSTGGTTVTNDGLPILTWGRGEIYFSNSSADYLAMNGTMQGGSNIHNATGTGRRIGGSTTQYVDMDIAEIVYVNRLPTETELALWGRYLGVPQ